MMWKYGNPVQIEFGIDSFAKVAELIGSRRYALVTYGESLFDELVTRLKKIPGTPVLVVSDVAPNPDYRLLAEQTGRFAEPKW
jgi:alcohol dehydrogenase